MASSYVKPNYISLSKHPEYNEKWVHARISDDPSILGLGDLSLKELERQQPSKGRLDLLLFDPESNRRYEVEVQLGASDESHIIRTIEYWDYERRRLPQYEHCAVLVAEDITTRFLNVVSLFNGVIPIIAIQMTAIELHGAITLVFTKVLNVLTLATDEEDEGEIVDRRYWEAKASEASLKLMDVLVDRLQTFAAGFAANYNKHYIGLSRNGISQNFVEFTPRKTTVILGLKHPQDESIQAMIDQSDLDMLAYDHRWNQYRLRLTERDVRDNESTLTQLMNLAHDSYMA